MIHDVHPDHYSMVIRFIVLSQLSAIILCYYYYGLYWLYSYLFLWTIAYQMDELEVMPMPFTFASMPLTLLINIILAHATPDPSLQTFNCDKHHVHRQLRSKFGNYKTKLRSMPENKRYV